ncbi:MAG: hypothetical protein ACLGG7_01570 [Bacteriovoracia bacterium]
MIEVNVIDATDPEYLGTWKFRKNQIYLGHPSGDIAPHGLLFSYAFMIEVLPDFIQVQPHPDLEFWLLNGKRATKPRKVKIGDHLQVGDLALTITSVAHQELPTKKQILDRRLKELVSSQSPVLEVIQALNPKTK